MKTAEEKKEAKRIANAKYNKNKLAKVKKSKSDWREKNKNYNSEYYIKNKEKIKFNTKDYKLKNEDSIKLTNKKYYDENKVIILTKMNETYLNRDKKLFNEIRRKYYKEKIVIMAWRRILKSSLIRLVKTKEAHTIDLLGYSALELKQHLESLFTEGMSWDNYGEWHVDHIKCVYEFNDDTHPSIVNALSNLRPLWATTREINGIIYEGNLNRPKH